MVEHNCAHRRCGAIAHQARSEGVNREGPRVLSTVLRYTAWSLGITEPEPEPEPEPLATLAS